MGDWVYWLTSCCKARSVPILSLHTGSKANGPTVIVLATKACSEAPRELRGLRERVPLPRTAGAPPRTYAMEHRALKHRWNGGARWSLKHA